MDARVRKFVEDADRAFADRKPLDSLWQEIALHFYPEVADFTATRYLGEDYASHLSTSYPLIARRTLGDSLSAMLRPVALDTTSPGIWFSMRADADEDFAAKRWLERATHIQRKAMYDRLANFVRATKEGDHMFATFGQAPLSVMLNRETNTLLYQAWPLKDVCWIEDATGQICTVFRRWSPTATQLVELFRNAHARVKEKLSQTPYDKVACLHIVTKAEKYEQRDANGKKFATPWVSLWIDTENEHVMEERGAFTPIYLIPRWVTAPGTQYAHSPAVMAALPDARLIQAMTLTLLEAAEKHADPPLVATQEAVKTSIDTFAGGITYIDAEYDERLGEALRPLYNPTAGQGAALGLDMRADIRDGIARAFFLDSLSLPPADVRDMTAFETAQRISEWIRRAMPIFEPMEFEYNGALCEATFNLLMRNNGFGPIGDIPRSLLGSDVVFKFESPLHESNDRRKGQKFLEAKTALAQAAEIDPSVIPMIRARETLRDVLEGIGVPMEWQRSDQEMDDIERARREEQAAQQMAGTVELGAEAAKNIGAAVKDFAAARAA